MKSDEDFGPKPASKELPLCVGEKAYFAKTGWLKAGFDLLQYHVHYKRDYLILRMKGDGDGALDNRMASYGYGMVACFGRIATCDGPATLGTQGTALLDRAFRPSGGSPGGRVARLQAIFANMAREEPIRKPR